MLQKVFAITQKAVKVSKFMSLIADTIEYFSKEGVKRQIFGNSPEITGVVAPLLPKYENE